VQNLLESEGAVKSENRKIKGLLFSKIVSNHTLCAIIVGTFAFTALLFATKKENYRALPNGIKPGGGE
jgi:hypothetical protein